MASAKEESITKMLVQKENEGKRTTPFIEGKSGENLNNGKPHIARLSLKHHKTYKTSVRPTRNVDGHSSVARYQTAH